MTQGLIITILKNYLLEATLVFRTDSCSITLLIYNKHSGNLGDEKLLVNMTPKAENIEEKIDRRDYIKTLNL